MLWVGSVLQAHLAEHTPWLLSKLHGGFGLRSSSEDRGWVLSPHHKEVSWRMKVGLVP